MIFMEFGDGLGFRWVLGVQWRSIEYYHDEYIEQCFHNYLILREIINQSTDVCIGFSYHQYMLPYILTRYERMRRIPAKVTFGIAKYAKKRMVGCEF